MYFGDGDFKTQESLVKMLFGFYWSLGQISRLLNNKQQQVPSVFRDAHLQIEYPSRSVVFISLNVNVPVKNPIKSGRYFAKSAARIPGYFWSLYGEVSFCSLERVETTNPPGKLHWYSSQVLVQIVVLNSRLGRRAVVVQIEQPNLSTFAVRRRLLNKGGPFCLKKKKGELDEWPFLRAKKDIMMFTVKNSSFEALHQSSLISLHLHSVSCCFCLTFGVPGITCFVYPFFPSAKCTTAWIGHRSIAQRRTFVNSGVQEWYVINLCFGVPQVGWGKQVYLLYMTKLEKSMIFFLKQ